MTGISRLSFGLVLIGSLLAGSAQAFTYDNRTNQNPDGSARFTDPLAPSSASSSSKKKSGFSMQFSGGGGFGNQRGYGDSRFLPSANGAFSSPFDGPSNLDRALGYGRN